MVGTRSEARYSVCVGLTVSIVRKHKLLERQVANEQANKHKIQSALKNKKGFISRFHSLTAGAPFPTYQATKLCLASLQKPLRDSETTHAHLPTLLGSRQHHD